MTQQRCPPGFESGKSSFLGIAPDRHIDIISKHYQCKTRIRRILDKSQCVNVELSPQKPLKRSSDLQGWSVAEQYIDRARSESRLATMTSFDTKLKKDCTSFI